ncbi:MAG: hypothetical protein MPF33_02240 [Candidatus Aramenus sp.]|jgi:hypothetical protein|nr:hypothetical protein [Candidatus Aramenus sp.]
MQNIIDKLKEKGYRSKEIKVKRVEIQGERLIEMRPFYAIETELMGKKVLLFVGKLKLRK